MTRGALRFAALSVVFLLPACGDPSSTAALILSPSKVFFTGPEAGPDPANQQVVMTGSDQLWFGQATWSATSDQPWLSVTPTSGSILSGKKATLTLHVGLGNGWKGATSTVGAPFADATTIPGWGAWTGSAMLIWSGDPAVPAKYYDPVTDTWFGSTTTIGAPSKRSAFSAVGTGTEMIIWGGHSFNPTVALNTGARYNPASDTWTPMSTAGAPSGRAAHRAVWTGSRMIVWGGDGLGFSYTNTGGIYNPATDTWTGATSTVNAPTPRGSHVAVWTGTEMIIWGGENPSKFNDGKFYNPATDTWSGSTTTIGAPSARSHLQAVWTGQEMVLWGGGTAPFSNVYENTGARYNPVSDSWISLPVAGAPEARSSHNVIWTGSEVIVWGGVNATSGINTGGILRIAGPTAGSYVGHVKIKISSGPGKSNQTIPVSLTVTP